MIDTLPVWFPHFESCGKCNIHGFIIEGDTSHKCNCKIQYDELIFTLRKLLESNIIVENSS